MVSPRRSQRELRDAKKVVRQEEMQRAIAEGRLVIRTMTPEERDRSYARRGRGTPRRTTGRP